MDMQSFAFNWGTVLSSITVDTKQKYAILLLNHCFDNILQRKKSKKIFFQSGKFQKFQYLWNRATVRMAVDGGANVLRYFQQSSLRNNYLDDLKNPTFITGDFDSIRNDVKNYFKQEKDITFISTRNQSKTDFTKALLVLKKHFIDKKEDNLDSILVFYASFGRIDQYLSILSTVHSTVLTEIPIILIDSIGSISFVLNEGFHKIPRIEAAQWCSLIPLCGPVTLSTTGLRWNLEEQILEFGKFISSSNEFDPKSDQVIINVIEKKILFSFDYQF